MARIAANNLAHPPTFQQCCQAGVAIAGVVIDNREVAGALRKQAFNQFNRNTRRAKPPYQNGGAVRYAHQCLGHAGGNFIDHKTS